MSERPKCPRLTYYLPMAIRLYEGPISPNARKVRLVAAELGIPLERVTLDMRRGDFQSAEYLAKNPNGTIPTIEDDGFVLWESAAILKYLVAKRPDGGLVPTDARGQALLDQWLFWWAAHPEAALLRLVVERLLKPFRKQETSKELAKDAETALDRFLPHLEHQLDGREYTLGRLSLVDFVVGPWLEAAPRLGVDLTSRYPNLQSLLVKMQARPYWKDA
jgi:glutathione S-transferase